MMHAAPPTPLSPAGEREAPPSKKTRRGPRVFEIEAVLKLGYTPRGERLSISRWPCSHLHLFVAGCPLGSKNRTSSEARSCVRSRTSSGRPEYEPPAGWLSGATLPAFGSRTRGALSPDSRGP